MTQPGPGVVPRTERTPRVVAARQLQRRRRRQAERRFLAEGPQSVREALAAGDALEIFASVDTAERHAELLALAQTGDVPVSWVTEKALASLAETVTPQGVVAVCAIRDAPLAETLAERPRLAAVLAEVSDPGNAGTVLRTADAAGATTVWFTEGSVDPYNGKCVRASAGSLFHVRLASGGDVLTGIGQLREAGLQVLAATGSGETDLYEFADRGGLDAPTAWLFGAEAQGLSAAAAAAADHRVRAPIYGGAESLNLAAAAAVCLYASARAHRKETAP